MTRGAWTAARCRLLGVALLAVAAIAIAARGGFADLLAGGGAGVPQRPLAGGAAGEDPAPGAPVRVVVIDGLGRADAARLATLERLCAAGLDVVVDVGFPTKSLPVQRALWTGLTPQQSGGRGDNRPHDPPAGAIPPAVHGLAVVESHGAIARSVGFATTEAGDALAARAAAIAATDAPLVMIHVLGVDVAAHRGGRRGAAYASALARADDVLARAHAAAPLARWLVVSDHGHLVGGGHGDVEDEVRRVRACWAPAPSGVDRVAARGAELHLVDVSRWIAAATGAPRAPRAVGRPLATALAHPDPDATLPAIPGRRIAVAIAIALAGLGAAAWASRRRWPALWPVASAAIVLAAHGVPTLSARAPVALLAAAGALPALGAWWLERRSSPGRVTLAVLGGITAVTVALAVVAGVPAALAGGPPPRVPYWTGVLGAAAHLLVAGVSALGVALALGGRRAAATG